jgi:acyl-CoA thioester hydrolase
VSSPPLYRTAVAPEWIDYNGHLRDAYYVVVLSSAIDALMDRLGLDAGYRERTRCTLYSLEMHLHWLHEVTLADELEVEARILAADLKRLHLGLEVRIARHPGPVATAEFMLLHVHQGAKPAAVAFPPEIAAAIARLQAAAGATPWAGPRSRPLALPVR